MLVVTRKRSEAIVIGEGIEVRVLRVGRNGVRLGITAPSQIAVHRSEIFDQIRAANAAAAATLPTVEALDRLRGQIADTRKR